MLPRVITPRPKDAQALAAARHKLTQALECHHWRERRVVMGVASPETIDCVLRMRYLSRVLAGPRPLTGLRLARQV